MLPRFGLSEQQAATMRLLVGRGFVALSFLALAVLCFSPGMQAAQRIRSDPQPSGGLITLRGNTRPEANAANDRGPVADDSAMEHMMLLLHRTPEQEQALEKLINDLHDQASPIFHHWITAEEFGRTYGAAPADISRVTDWLESQGFQVNLVYPNRILIDFSGSAGQVHQAFHTEMHHLMVNGQAHIANMSDPQIPEALGSIIKGIISLNDFRPRPMLRPRANYNAGWGSQLVVPADLAKIYNFNPLFAAGISGQGQTIVLIEDTDLYTTADWNTFRSVMGLASAYPLGSLTQVHPPSSPKNNCTDPGANGDDAEAALDVEWASAGAPSATSELASCSDTMTFGGFIALQNLLNASATPPAIVSISYGESESYLGASTNAYISSLYQQAAAEGVSVFVSAGDWGAELSGASNGITASGFTSTPYNVSVGGTDFADTYQGLKGTYWSSTNSANFGSALSYVPEIPWNDSCASVLIADYAGILPTYGSDGLCNSDQFIDNIAGSGGPSGCATGAPDTPGAVSGSCAGYPKPSWQAGLLGNPNDGVRDVPDVSLFAANGVWDHYYVACYSDPNYGGPSCSGPPSTWAGFGGTSVSSPIMAAMQALVNQGSGSRWGNPNPAYYALARSEYGSGGSPSCVSSLGANVGSTCVFYDVTQIPLLYTGTGTGGDNDVLCSGLNCYAPSGFYGVLSTAPQTLTSAYVTFLGGSYTSAPSCTITGGGGSGATCSASITGVVSSLQITNGGSGFSPYGEPVCTLTGGGGTGATCAAYVGDDDKVDWVSLTSFGSGYTSAPTCTINRDDGGGATCTATVTQGIAVSLTAPGSGYTSLPACVLSGGGGRGGTCAALATNTSDAYQPAFGATPGWDFTTGIGTVNAANLVASFVSSTATLSSTSLTFPPQVLNTSSAAQSVTVTNTGTGNLIILAVTISGKNASDFAKSADTCTGATVVPNGACTVSVTFTPSSASTESASLSFSDIAPNNPQTVSLTGNGSSPASGWQLEPGSFSQVSVGSDGTVWGINGAGQVDMFNPQTQTWQQAPGLFSQIAVGASGFVWALNAAGQIYRYDPTLQSWDQIPGALSQIAVGSDGDVWGIGSSAQVYHFNSATQNLVQIPGTLAQIAVGYDGAIWGTNAAQQVYRFNPGTQSWQQIPGALKRVAVGADGDVWGINNAGQTYHFNSLSQRWDNAPGSLAQIAVGSASNVWGIDAAGAIWRFNAQAQAWNQIPGQLTQIGVGANGAVWGLNSANQIYQFVEPTQPTQTLHQVGGVFAEIATGLDGEVWGIDAAQQTWRYDAQRQSWEQIPITLSEIRVGFGGNVWGLNAAGQVWQFNPSTQSWNQILGSLAQLEVGADGSVWGIDSAGRIWRFNPSTQGFAQIPGTLAQLAVGADGTVWGINSADQVWHFNPSTQGWQQMPGGLAQIAVGSANNVWGLGAAGQIWRYDPQLQKWDSIPGALTSIAVAFDGTVWGLNSANQIWRFNAQTQSWNSIPAALSQVSVGADAVVWGLSASGQAYEYW
jgi:hypothetical protein